MIQRRNPINLWSLWVRLDVHLLLTSVTNHDIMRLAISQLHLRWPRYSKSCDEDTEEAKRQSARVAVAYAEGTQQIQSLQQLRLSPSLPLAH